MAVKDFSVSDDDEFVDAFGVAPNVVASVDSTVRVLILNVGEMGKVELSFDEVARSVRAIWRHDQMNIIDLFWEQVVSLSVDSKGEKSGFRIDFESGDFKGNADFQVTPTVAISGALLAR